MKITIESTSKLVDLEVDGKTVPARIWEGKTETGIPVVAYVTRILPQTQHPEILADFADELLETRAPTLIYGFDMPLRLML